MKIIIRSWGVVILFMFSSQAVSATVGDINGDGKIGLQEAIHALQVVAGTKPEVPGSYNNSSLQGTWILTDASGYNGIYAQFDGAGTITEAGAFNMPTPVGTYQVQGDGSFTLHLEGIPDLPGQLTSETQGTWNVSDPIYKVTDLSACQGTWSGSWSETGAGTTNPISITVDANGIITNLTGLAGPVTGKLFCASGKVAGHVYTGETTNQDYGQFSVIGIVSDATIDGFVLLDNGGANDPDATIDLIRQSSVVPGTVVSATGEVWMDRNLGASRVATSLTDAEAYGDLYQWGRDSDGHEKRTSPTTSTLSTSDEPGHGSFILAPGTPPNDWRTPQNANLWQGVSGINNPCPSGFRLPTATELETERNSWSVNNSAGAFASPLKLVVAGSRDSYSGALGFAGYYGGFWSSTVDGSFSRALGLSSESVNVYMYSSVRASGTSVRCLKD